MIGVNADLSLNTIVISAVVGLVGWALKGTAWALGETCKQLIETLIKTITKVEVLESKITAVLAMRAEVDKLKYDVNNLYAKVREDKTQ